MPAPRGAIAVSIIFCSFLATRFPLTIIVWVGSLTISWGLPLSVLLSWTSASAEVDCLTLDVEDDSLRTSWLILGFSDSWCSYLRSEVNCVVILSSSLQRVRYWKKLSDWVLVATWRTELDICFVVASSHPSPSVLIPALRTVGNIVTGDDLQTQVTRFSHLHLSGCVCGGVCVKLGYWHCKVGLMHNWFTM